MKINLKSVLLWVGMSLIISGPCALAHTDVTAEKARELIDSTDDLIVIDVREPSEYSDTGGHIPGALNYPLYSGVLLTRYEELPMDGPVLVVCGSGSRSHQAAKFLDSKDFSMVYDMQAGMSAWIWETETGVDTNIKYGGGTGEPNDPYQIATAEDLILLGESPEDYNKHFILTADIDLDPNLPGRKVFDRAVIAPDANDREEWFQGTSFTGVFDGKGHSVSHLTIRGRNCLGLFGCLASGSEVRNLSVVDVNLVASGNWLGGLAGSSDGHVTGCYSTGTVSGNSYVGGLMGDNSEGSVTQCHSAGVVDGNDCVGGLVGMSSGSVTYCYCYSTAAVDGSVSVGGLVGANLDLYLSGGVSITGSYSSGKVSGTERVGGLVGESVSGSIVATHSSASVNGKYSVGGLIGRNGQRTPVDVPGSAVTDCYGTGPVSGDLDVGGLVGDNYGGSVTQCHSTGAVSGDSCVGGLVGTNDYHDYYRGYIGVTTDCYSSGTGDGNNYVGGLVGENFLRIKDSYSTGSVIGNLVVGGLVGQNAGSLTGCCCTGTISGYDCVGGLVGGNYGPVTQCHSTGPISGDSGVGGLVGGNYGASVTRCYSSGAVSGSGNSVGGLVGTNGNSGGGIRAAADDFNAGRCVASNGVREAGYDWPPGSIGSCYSVGPVTGRDYVGGLVGLNEEGEVTQCYSTGAVSGSGNNVGGLVGNRLYVAYVGEVTNCFWDTETSGCATSDGGTGKTTAEMQTAQTFLDTGWDFAGETANGTEDIWSICEGTNYPRLVWQIAAGDFVCPDGITIDDFLFFMEHWLDDNCDSSNGYCQGTDLDQSGTVDAYDLEIFFENWSAEK